jgi:pimeloyl-ACP methyl ester carboxylesterase
MDHGQVSRALFALAQLSAPFAIRYPEFMSGNSIVWRSTPRTSSRRRQECRQLSGDNSFCYLAFLLVIACSCATVATPPISLGNHSTVKLTLCQLPKHTEAALCGKHQVFENRLAKSGRMIALNIIVLPARSSESKAEPIFYLAGGPGQGAARIAGAGEDAIMRELRRERDLVFIDMRGTGDSNGLQCDSPIDRRTVQSFFREIFEPKIIQACRERLETVADLKFYNSQLAIADVDDVRLALGYDKINLYGISHGSQAALEYLRRYPENVRSAVLAGVATAAIKTPLQFANGAEQAMKRLFHDCAADPTCNNAFPDLPVNFTRLLRSFDNGALTFQVRTGKVTESITLSRGVFAVRLLSLLYSHRTISLVPLILDRAAQGDWLPYVQVMSRSAAPAEYRVYLGTYLSTTCSESLRFIDETELASATAGTFMGDYRVRRHQQACANWPGGELDSEYFQPARATTPVLMLSGDIDPATPAEFGAMALKTLPNGRQVILRNTPHSYTSPCARSLIVEFITHGSAKELDATCAVRLRRPPFATELPASYNR